MLERENEDGEEKRIPLARLSSVFNEEQIEWSEGAPAAATPEAYPDAQVILTKSGADIRSGGERAYYSPAEDYIRLPAFDAFGSEHRYWATALHELVHWTGHASRLGRPFGAVGTEAYAFEELVAEIGNCMLCTQIGVEPEFGQSAAYVEGWLEAMKEDSRAIFRAASEAQKAVDYIMERTAQADRMAAE